MDSLDTFLIGSRSCCVQGKWTDFGTDEEDDEDDAVEVGEEEFVVVLDEGETEEEVVAGFLPGFTGNTNSSGSRSRGSGECKYSLIVVITAEFIGFGDAESGTKDSARRASWPMLSVGNALEQ